MFYMAKVDTFVTVGIMLAHSGSLHEGFLYYFAKRSQFHVMQHYFSPLGQ